MCFSFPWIPLAELDNLHGLIRQECELLADQSPLYDYTQVLLNYLETQWLNNPEIPREQWNFYNDSESDPSNNNMVGCPNFKKI